MSSLTSAEKAMLRTHVRGGELFELFPGDDPDSINFFRSCDALVMALGDYRVRDVEVSFIEARVPPYPALNHQFDYVFINEALWLAHMERTTQGQPYSGEPMQGTAFVHSILKPGGLFLMTKLHAAEAKYYERHFRKLAQYALELDETVCVLRKPSVSL